MITGDKQETAVNIGSSCGLIKAPDKLLLCNAPSSRDAAHDKLLELLARAEKVGPNTAFALQIACFPALRFA